MLYLSGKPVMVSLLCSSSRWHIVTVQWFSQNSRKRCSLWFNIWPCLADITWSNIFICALTGYDDSEDYWRMSLSALLESFLHTCNKQNSQRTVQVNLHLWQNPPCHQICALNCVPANMHIQMTGLLSFSSKNYPISVSPVCLVVYHLKPAWSVPMLWFRWTDLTLITAWLYDCIVDRFAHCKYFSWNCQ